MILNSHLAVELFLGLISDSINLVFHTSLDYFNSDIFLGNVNNKNSWVKWVEEVKWNVEIFHKATMTFQKLKIGFKGCFRQNVCINFKSSFFYHQILTPSIINHHHHSQFFFCLFYSLLMSNIKEIFFFFL